MASRHAYSMCGGFVELSFLCVFAFLSTCCGVYK
jgi:hypothetical protein